LFEHDLFGKPVPTFPDHALEYCARSTLARRTDQSDADHQRRRPINDDRHRELGEAACGARTSAGPWDAKAAFAHNRQAMANGVAKAAGDIRGNFRDDAILRDDAMTISCDRKRSEDTDGSLYRF